MKSLAMLIIFGVLSVALLWAPINASSNAPIDDPVTSHSATTHKLISELSDEITTSIRAGTRETVSSARIELSSPKSPGDCGEFYCIRQDGSKLWIGAARGAVNLPTGGPVHLVLPPDKALALRLLEEVSKARINVVEVPSPCVSNEVFLAVTRLSHLTGLKVFGGTFDKALVDRLSLARNLRSLTLMNVSADKATMSRLTVIKSIDQLKCIGMVLPQSFLAELKKMPDLTDVDLDDCTLPSGAVKDLSAIKGLRSLSLANTGVTDEDCAELGKVSSLKSLRLDRNKISDVGCVELSRLRDLQSLEVRLTPVGDCGVTQLLSLPKLTRLDLACTAVSDNVMKKVACSRVSDISLSGTNITDSGAFHLFEYPALKRLVLDETEVSDSLIESLRKKHSTARIF